MNAPPVTAGGVSDPEVTSSRLCKKSEGAGFPFQVKAMEDGIDCSVHALNVHKADDRSGSAPHSDKTTLNNLGGPQLLPQMFRKAESKAQPVLRGKN
jgi:hypothetical protein